MEEIKRFLVVNKKSTADELLRMGLQMVQSSMGHWVFLNAPQFFNSEDKPSDVVETNIISF